MGKILYICPSCEGIFNFCPNFRSSDKENSAAKIHSALIFSKLERIFPEIIFPNILAKRALERRNLSGEALAEQFSQKLARGLKYYD